MRDLFPSERQLERVVTSRDLGLPAFDALSSLKQVCGDVSKGDLIKEAVRRVFHLPSVGSKSFLITIGDRTVGGLSVRDQMVGPWQTPVADCAVTATSFSIGGVTRTGEVMAMGERPPLALIDPAASARMAVAESLLNLSAADYLVGEKESMERIKLSANWMAAVNEPGEGAGLFKAVQALGEELCPALKISIPVGKDSTSMKASWKDKETKEAKSVTAPMSVIITAASIVEDVRKTWTPQLRRQEEVGETLLMFVDLGLGKKAMGGSGLAQTFGEVGNESPDVRDVQLMRDYMDAINQLHQAKSKVDPESGVVLAYHDRSDGGLATTIAEMMFAGRCGVAMDLDELTSTASEKDMLEALFNEELGAVFQIRKDDETNFIRCFATCGPPRGLIKKFGTVLPRNKQHLNLRYGARSVVSLDRVDMQQWWSRTSYAMQKERDNPACAEAEYSTISESTDPGISYRLTYKPDEDILPLTAKFGSLMKKAPRVAILREVGVNSHREMAFAFKAAGFEPVDVHMSDLIEGYRSLNDFVGLAAGGGFSYGDVFGAGVGWAQSILEHEAVRKDFESFFNRVDTFSIGVCNGCQMLTRLKSLIPGAEKWPKFIENTSRQYEGRFSMVKIEDTSSTPSIFLHGMSGSYLPIAVAHGEGRASFSSSTAQESLEAEGLIPIKFVDNRLRVAQAEDYPYNPNGSPGGVAGVSSRDGRVLALMPHPERTIMADVGSYVPPDKVAEWGEFGPWVRLFKSARRWVG